MPKPITKIEVRCSESGPFAVSCVYDGDRYHFWVNRETYEPEQNAPNSGTGFVLFKNPPVTVNVGQPGYYRTRRLSSESAFSQTLITEMMKEARGRNLFVAAEEANREDKRRALLQAEMSATQRKHQEFTEDLLGLLRAVHPILEQMKQQHGETTEDRLVRVDIRKTLERVAEADAVIGEEFARAWTREGLGPKVH